MSLNSLRGLELKTILNTLESFAPAILSEKWDNTGLLVEPATARPVKCILLTNDLTEDVMQEALDINAGLIISYHPPIFKLLNKITTASWKERIIGTCLENKIAVYSPHTSWDSVPGGVNDWLAKAFGQATLKPIIEGNTTIPNSGGGRYCELKEGIKIVDAVERIKKLTSQQFLNLALARNASLDTVINKIAICAGAGSSVLLNVTADLFLTGEMPHHSLLDAIHKNTSVILCNHSNSERGFLKEFAKTLESKYCSTDVMICISKKDRDPIQLV